MWRPHDGVPVYEGDTLRHDILSLVGGDSSEYERGIVGIWVNVSISSICCSSSGRPCSKVFLERIHCVIKVVSPILYGLEDSSCVPLVFSGFDCECDVPCPESPQFEKVDEGAHY